MRPETDWLTPDWHVPGVRAYSSTRAGDFNLPPYDGFNTASHVGDDIEDVANARLWLAQHFHWQQPPQWLVQVHGVDVIEAQADGIEREGDAVVTFTPGQICTLHTADCLPVFFAAEDGSIVGLAHAGWRGLAAGVLQATLEKMALAPKHIKVWLGPAISQKHFEVGAEVKTAFIEKYGNSEQFFVANKSGRWQCDLYGLARLILTQQGVRTITGGNHCSYDDQRFFSYRRDQITGRMLSVIWIDPAQ